MSAPYGGLDAGLLISLGITAFYGTAPRCEPGTILYPNHLLWHLGGPWGSHGYLDFWPASAEVFLPEDPAYVFAAIYASQVTHLAVPDELTRLFMPVHGSEAIRRSAVRQMFAYGADGMARDANLVIHSSHPDLIENYEGTLRPERAMTASDEYLATLDPESEDAVDSRIYLDLMRSRINEVDAESPGRHAALRRLTEASRAGGIRESVRRVTLRV